ncbi:cupin domain-containing protein [Alicyclobacillus shizuokensis]|uniref:cupin domain-containing protein n=1 Tax=Alicyclobacillus shizuokensis TaxID=392014 RepID=UPI0012EE5551|nr:cupin domain-containing protein [Alicyclobacillus shizuokensis]MCL6627886.1 cupin domain-containing protein [Alicyclobacillus shizuokensis]
MGCQPKVPLCKEIDLNTGDSLFFHANVPHRFLNLGDTECKYFLVIDSYTAGPS